MIPAEVPTSVPSLASPFRNYSLRVPADAAHFYLDCLVLYSLLRRGFGAFSPKPSWTAQALQLEKLRMLFRSDGGVRSLASSDDSNLIGAVPRWNIVMVNGYVWQRTEQPRPPL